MADFLKVTTGKLASDTTFDGANAVSAAKSGTGAKNTPFTYTMVTGNGDSAAKSGTGAVNKPLTYDLVTGNDDAAPKGK